MQKFRNLLISAITISSVLLPLEITKAQEKIEVIPLIQSAKGLEVRRFLTPEGSKPSLDSSRLLFLLD